MSKHITESTMRLVLSLSFLVLSISSAVSAFDGKRSGFCLGFGAGIESITSFDKGVSGHHSRSGFQTTFDIGAGITDQLLLLYSGHTTNGASDASNDRLLWLEPTVVVRYYFRPTLRSLYIYGGPALAIGMGFAKYRDFPESGFGVTAGGGYQFNSHFQLQIGTALEYSEIDNYFRSIHMTMNVAWF